MEFSKKKIECNLSKEKIKTLLKNKSIDKEVRGILQKYLYGIDESNVVIEHTGEIDDKLNFTANEWVYILENSYDFSKVEIDQHSKKSKVAETILNAMTSVHMKKLLGFLLNRLVEPTIYITCDKQALERGEARVFVDAELESNIPSDIYEIIEYIAENRETIKLEQDNWYIAPKEERNIRMITTNMDSTQIESSLFKSEVLSKEEYSILHKYMGIQYRKQKRVNYLKERINELPAAQYINGSHRELVQKLMDYYYSLSDEEQGAITNDEKLGAAVNKLIRMNMLKTPNHRKHTLPEQIYFNKDELRHLLKHSFSSKPRTHISEAAQALLSAMHGEVAEEIVAFLCNFYVSFDIDFYYNEEYLDPEISSKEKWIPVTTEVYLDHNLPYDLSVFLENLSYGYYQEATIDDATAANEEENPEETDEDWEITKIAKA